MKLVGKKKEVLYDKDKKIEWDGLFVIMVNSFFVLVLEILVVVI